MTHWHVTIRPVAKADLRTARQWYEDRRSGLGDELLLCVVEAMLRLEASPAQFPIYYNGFRRLLIDRFPYKISFRIEGDDVIVFRVLHTARDHRRELE